MANRDTPSGGRRPDLQRMARGGASALIHDLQMLFTARSLRRVKDGGRPRTRARHALDWRTTERVPHNIAPAEVGALIDLGLSDGAVAAYLLDGEDLAEPQRRTPPSDKMACMVEPELPMNRAPVLYRAHILYRALGRVSAATMRRQARQLIFAARRSADAEQRTSLAARAYALTEAAEALEARGESADPGANLSPRLRGWRLRAEEYRTIADALPPGTARDTYLHLARAYDGLAERR